MDDFFFLRLFLDRLRLHGFFCRLDFFLNNRSFSFDFFGLNGSLFRFGFFSRFDFGLDFLSRLHSVNDNLVLLRFKSDLLIGKTFFLSRDSSSRKRSGKNRIREFLLDGFVDFRNHPIFESLLNGIISLKDRKGAFSDLRGKTDISTPFADGNTLVSVPDNNSNLREDIAAVILDFLIMDIGIEEIIRAGPTDDSSRFPGFDDLKGLIFSPALDIDLFSVEFGRDSTGTGVLRSDAGTDRIDIFIARVD